ncbi:MAG TPA: hypothetical protein VF510_26775 [Ktedonobacterales bacterium]
MKSVAVKPGSAALTLIPAVWTSSYVALSVAGLYKPIWEYDSSTLLKDLSAHLAYGLTAATFAFLARVSYRFRLRHWRTHKAGPATLSRSTITQASSPAPPTLYASLRPRGTFLLSSPSQRGGAGDEDPILVCAICSCPWTSQSSGPTT